MTNHTPGPWIAKERHANYRDWVVLAETACGQRRVDGKDGTFSEADARLIAAAPDLLFALEWLSSPEAIEGDGVNLEAALAAARKAIAKATA